MKSDLFESAGFPEVPLSWERVRLRFAFRLVSRAYRSSHDLLSVYLNRGVIPYAEGGGLVHKPSEDLSGYQFVQRHDLVLNNQQAWRGSVGVSSFHGNVSPAYVVLEPQGSWDSTYLNYLSRSQFVVNQFEAASRGVGDIQRQVNIPLLKNVVFPKPPIEIQKSIAKFLDRETSQIDALIEKQKQLVETLNARRNAVIVRSVTRGLNNNSEFRSTGLEWLPQIPADWAQRPFFTVGSEIKNKNTGMFETNLLSLSFGEIVNRDIDSNDGLLPESFDGYQIIQPHDLVFRFTDLQNDQKSLRSAISRSKGIITSAYLAVRLNSQNPEFMAFLMRGYDLLKVFYAMGGGLRQSMKFDDIRRLPLFFPSLQEQERIVEFLTKTTSEIDLLKTKALDMVQLLQERRQALINAAVTGKIDVRGK